MFIKVINVDFKNAQFVCQLKRLLSCHAFIRVFVHGIVYWDDCLTVLHLHLSWSCPVVESLLFNVVATSIVQTILTDLYLIMEMMKPWQYYTQTMFLVGSSLLNPWM